MKTLQIIPGTSLLLAAAIFAAPASPKGDSAPPAGAPAAGKEKPAAPPAAPAPAGSTYFVNSLGMKFVPVSGMGVWFCAHETRVADFAAFVTASGFDYDRGNVPFTLGRDGNQQRAGSSWKNPGFTQAATHPVTCVSWDDAKAFCAWLSQKEGRTYRLPTDHEWSSVTGIGHKEDASATPAAKNGKIKDVYAWGTAWPPPAGTGNFYGMEARTGQEPPEWPVPSGYKDGFPRTAPVMSFAARRQHGIFDLSGNVKEWCEDWMDAGKSTRVIRGEGWDTPTRAYLPASARGSALPGMRESATGFRIVLVTSPPPAGAAPGKPAPGSPAAATKEVPFTNSLGMKFVPVLVSGMAKDSPRILFSVWETRNQDYASALAGSKVWIRNGRKNPTPAPFIR